MQLGKSATESHKLMKTVYCEYCMDKRSVQRWHTDFKSHEHDERSDIYDSPHSGQPKTSTTENNI